MTLDSSGLKDWPDPATIFNAAASLMEQGDSFYTNIEGAHSAWKGLGACYETPHQELLYSALDPALESTQHASDGCVSVQAAMTLFSDALSCLIPERNRLEEEAETYASKLIPEDGEKAREYELAGQDLQRRINALVQKYEEAIDACASQLSAIGDDGLPAADAPAWTDVASDTMLAALAAGAESRKVKIDRVVHRLVVRLFGRNFTLPYWVTYSETRFWDWKSWFKPNKSGSFLTRFRTALRATFFGPAPGKYGPASIIRNPNIPGNWGLGQLDTSQTRIDTSGIGRTVGRGLFIFGAALTYAKAEQRYREQNPEMSAAERTGRAVETATVRGTTQLGTVMFAGAAIGSVAPVGGTIVGLGIGVMIGLGMMIPIGENKTVGDLIGDAGEAVWNTISGWFR